MTGTSEQTVEPASQGSLVIHTYGYFSAHLNSDFSLVHSGPKSGEGYQYLAPDGTRYIRSCSYRQDGTPTGIISHGVLGPVIDGSQHSTLTVINHGSRTYGEELTEYSVNGAGKSYSPSPDLASSPAEVRQALENGEVTQQGTTTVHGTPALAVPVPVPRTVGRADSIHFTLYVDARTHQPLRTVTVVDGNPHPGIADRLPATPDNIAKAKDDFTIPAGYAKVDMSSALRPA